jgi:hypothetical protein
LAGGVVTGHSDIATGIVANSSFDFAMDQAEVLVLDKVVVFTAKASGLLVAGYVTNPGDLLIDRSRAVVWQLVVAMSGVVGAAMVGIAVKVYGVRPAGAPPVSTGGIYVERDMRGRSREKGGTLERAHLSSSAAAIEEIHATELDFNMI